MSVARGQEALELDLFDDVGTTDDVPTVALRPPVALSAEVPPPDALTEALTDAPADPEPTMALARPSVAGSLPARPRSIALPPRPPALSPVSAWVRTARPAALPATLLGGAVGGLLVARDTAARPVLLAVGLLLLVLGHVLAGLVRDLGDARPGRAGALRRREAGRATLAVTGAAAVAVVVLAVVHDGRGAVLLPAGALALLLVVSRRAGVLLGALAGLLAGTLAVVTAVWAGTGTTSVRSMLAGLVVGGVLAGLLAPRRARVVGGATRVLVLLPYLAAGAAVWATALPWPALAVALALPAARTASSAASTGAAASRSDAGPVVAGHARLFAVLLVGGLVAAAVTGTDLPLA